MIGEHEVRGVIAMHISVKVKKYIEKLYCRIYNKIEMINRNVNSLIFFLYEEEYFAIIVPKYIKKYPSKNTRRPCG